MNKVVKKVLNFLIGDRSGTFFISRDAKGEWRFVLKAGNNEIVAIGEGYQTQQGCLNGILVVKKLAVGAHIEEV